MMQSLVVRSALAWFLASGERTRAHLDDLITHWAFQHAASADALPLHQEDAWEEYVRRYPWEVAPRLAVLDNTDEDDSGCDCGENCERSPGDPCPLDN